MIETLGTWAARHRRMVIAGWLVALVAVAIATTHWAGSGANWWIPGWLDRILPRLEPEPAPAEGLPAPAYAAESAGTE